MNRYDRQTLLPEIGEEGQRKLSAAKVLLIGMGGLGSPIALYLVGAGVGTIGLVDDDVVSITNLQRQIIYTEAEIGQSKVLCAQKRLQQLNSEIIINSFPIRLDKDNAETIISQYDIVVDGCDNFATRYLINDICVLLNKVYVYGAIRSLEGQVSVFNYKKKINYRHLCPDQEDVANVSPLDKGVMGITPAIVGSIEATEVIKLICGFGEVLDGKLWMIDLRTMQTNIISL
ncbi:MAG: HesA/MoeB/ThiF family protein [Bacteroides sp.]